MASLFLTCCSTNFSPALCLESVQQDPGSGLLEGCNANPYYFCWFNILPILCSLAFSCTSAPFLPFLTLQLYLSFNSLPIPHLAFCPLCLNGSQFCSHRSHPSLPDPLHMKVQHRVTPTFQRHVLLQLQTTVSRLRTGVLTASSNTHQT